MSNIINALEKVDELVTSEHIDFDTIKNVKSIVNKLYNDYSIEPNQINESLVGVQVKYNTKKWKIELDISPLGEMNFYLDSKNIQVQKIFLSIDDFFSNSEKYFS